jgi:hypothetical protein
MAFDVNGGFTATNYGGNGAGQAPVYNPGGLTTGAGGDPSKWTGQWANTKPDQVYNQQADGTWANAYANWGNLNQQTYDYLQGRGLIGSGTYQPGGTNGGSAAAPAQSIANGFASVANTSPNAAWGDMTNTQNVTDKLGNALANNYGYAQGALGNMADSYNQISNLMGPEYTKYFNAQQNNLNEIHSKINSGYDEMQSYMPQAQAAYDNAQGNLGTLAPLLADQQNAYYDMGRDMETLREAYQNVLNGTVPEETKAMLEQIYSNQMAQATTALNDSYDRSSTNMLDNLGARGILSGTTSAQANTGLASELLKAIQDAEYSYGTDKLKTLIETPYRQFDAATNLYNSSGQMVSAAGDIVNSGLGIQNAYNQNFGNALGLANQANSNYGQLLNGLQQQAANGQLPLSNILNQVGGIGANANLANNIFQNAQNPMMDFWNALNQNEIAMMTSGQASDPGSSSDSWIGPAINAGASIIGSLFG